MNNEDGTFWEYAYNTRGEVITATLKHGTSTLPGWNYGYGYDSIGNRTTLTGTSGTGTYTLNTRNQVTSATDGGLYVVKGRAPNSSTPAITVDTVSQTVTKGTYGTNDYFKSDVSSSGPDYEQVIVTSGGDSGTWFKAVPPGTDNPTYDYSGNLITDWRWTYTWDAYDRLIKMVTKSTAVSAGVPNLTLDFVYDHMGRRVRKTVKIGTSIASNTKFVYNGWNLVAELNAMTSDSLVRRYLWGADLTGTLQGAGGVGGLLAIGQVAGTATDQMVCIDGNGNIMALVDAALSTSAAIKARYTYDAFGQKNRAYGVFAATNPFGFSSKYEDSETGLLYYGYRFYDPAGGRWLSRDPIGEGGGLNLYGFVGNNAVSQWDYLGQDFIAIGKTNVDASLMNFAAPGNYDEVENPSEGRFGHLVIAYWEVDCPLQESDMKWRTDGQGLFGWFDENGYNPKLVGTIELTPDSREWFFSGMQGQEGVFGGVTFSTIQFLEGEQAQRRARDFVKFRPLLDGDRKTIAAKWENLKQSAKDYEFAEESGFSTPKKFPKSVYGHPLGVYLRNTEALGSRPNIVNDKVPYNNSNTFVISVLNEHNLPTSDIDSAEFPGNRKPVSMRAMSNVYLKELK